MYEFQIKKMRNTVSKSRFSFKCDFSQATIGSPIKNSDTYEFPISGYSLLYKNEVIAQNLTGTLSATESDVWDSEKVDEVYDRMYDELITQPEKQFEIDHESDSDEDYRRYSDEFSEKMQQTNIELDRMFEDISFEPQSIKKMPSVTFKGSYDAYDGAQLDDEYVDELKVKIRCVMRIGQDSYDVDVQTEYSAFIPSDDAVMEMESFMETDED